MPSGTIKVRLTIQPSGQTTKAYIMSGPYKNTILDTCLSGVITKITFPPFDSNEAHTTTTTFKL